MENKLIAIYARVSTATQEEEQTVQVQLKVLLEEAAIKGYNIVEQYIDEGWSGDTLARPALDQLRQDAKRNIWQAVLIYDPDRLARRYSYQELVMDELREAGKEIIFKTIKPPANSEEKILYGVRGLFAEYERAKITERLRLGRLRRIKDGHLIARGPYGYDFIRRNEKVYGYYLINETEARVVRMIFDWANNGTSLRGIVKKLHDLKIVPKRSKSDIWQICTVSRLLRNTAYVGRIGWNKTTYVVPKNPKKKEQYKRNKKTSRIYKPEVDWIYISIPKIIDQNIFDSVQKRLKMNKSYSSRNAKKNYLLGGKVYCSCGKKRHVEATRTRKYTNYRCSDRFATYPIKEHCKEVSYRCDLLDNAVFECLTHLMVSPEILQKQLARWNSDQKNGSEDNGRQIPFLESEFIKLSKQEERLLAAYTSEAISLEVFSDTIKPIKNRISEIKMEVTNYKKQSESAIPQLSYSELKNFSRQAKMQLGKLTFSQKREIVINTVDKVVAGNSKLEVFGFIPVNGGSVDFLCLHDRCNVNTNEQLEIKVPFYFSFDLTSYNTFQRDTLGRIKTLNPIQVNLKNVIWDIPNNS